MKLTATGYVILALAGALTLSLGANVWLASQYLEARDETSRMDERRAGAQAVATACSEGVEKLAQAQDNHSKAVMAAIERARLEASKAYGKANVERNRPQAVPGDACASAQVETREWLERRRSGNGR